MAAGGPGDHPLSDILSFDHLVYNKKCDELVKELSKHFSGYELSVMFDWFEPYSDTESQLEAFEKILKDKLEEVIKLNKNL